MTFNIGADKVYSINELAHVVQRVSAQYGHYPTIEHVEARHEVQHAHSDHTLAKKHLGFVDDTNLESLINMMFEWAQKEPKREQKVMKYEVTKGIYDYWK